MDEKVEFLLGLLDRAEPQVSFEDFAGRHGTALRLWQRLGFVASVPAANPVPSCPHGCDGVPYVLQGQFRCNRCAGSVDRRHLCLWPINLATFLTWLAGKLRLDGCPQRIDDQLWQLGSLRRADQLWECFFCRSGRLSKRGQARLLAFRNALVLRPLPADESIDGFHGPSICLLELVRHEGRALTVADPALLLKPRGAVRFEEESGVLWAGDVRQGEVPFGSKEYHLLWCLWREADRYVAYADIKHYVLARSGTADSSDEATFCQKLKSRIKKRYVPNIDRLIATTNKGDGYRLRVG